jgi:hypothetical protein
VPEGVAYAVLRTGDGTFIHIVSYENEGDDDKISALPAFAKFLEGGAERRLGPPDRADVTIVGNYRLLGLPPA